MGVPAFFRWLSRKYPSVTCHCIEQKTVDINGVRIPIDSSEPNPNGVEFDNLYLDMNGIIHPCTHPEDRPAPTNEDEMMVAIFECVDRLFRIVRPRKLLYMAIDGVAPRAKMNQQRSRRFRAAKEAVEKVKEIGRVRSELLLKGASLPPEKAKGEHFDTNCITPGTPFMDRLSQCLHYYIHERLNNDPGWKGVKVILSDANVPGEGEHKIMDFIRKQRGQPDHDPNTQHCLCGADADLIMLGLATHEPNFTIIREEFKPNKPKPCDICGQIGHEMKECLGTQRGPDSDTKEFSAETDFIFVRLNVLREYLERELVMPNLPFKYEFERVLDDWVFMCFFVGNDFLPHLPSLEIREGAIDRLVKLYKNCVYKTGGYLTDSGNVNLERVQMIMLELGKAEDEIFKRRQENEIAFRRKRRRTDGYSQNRPNFSLLHNTQFAPKRVDQTSTLVNVRQESFSIRKAGMHTSSSVEMRLQTTSSTNALESMVRPVDETDNASGRGTKRPRTDDDESDDEQAHDEVRLWEDGFKDRYYESKFDVEPENLGFRYNVAVQYVRGLCWVLRYYYQGCASWNWYFPYHYAPFASDFVNISSLDSEFDSSTKPFNPLEQLMSVFPAASSAHVPEPWATLMSDLESPIIDFYPQDFKIDLNGKKYAWQGVALLPFVDEKRLFKALKPYYKLLTDEERRRNLRGEDRLYVSSKNQGYGFIKGLYTNKVQADMESAICIDGMRGTVMISSQCVRSGGNLESPVRGLLTLTGNVVYCVNYRDPTYPQGFTFPAKRLKGAKDPLRVLKPQDFEERGGRNWRPIIGMVPSNTRATLGQAGHRMVNHHVPRPVAGTYSNVPPPSHLDNRGGYYQHRGPPSNNNNNNHQGGGGGYWGSYGGGGGGYGGNSNNGGGYSGGNRSGYGNQQQRSGYGYNSPYQQGYQSRGRNERGMYERDNRAPGPYRDSYVPNSNRNDYGR